MINNRKLTIRELAEDLNIGSIQDIVVNGLSLRRVAAKLVPKELNFMQKKDRVVIAKDMISKTESDPTFIKRIITGDEMWIYEYDTQFRHQASESFKWAKTKKTTSFSVEKCSRFSWITTVLYITNFSQKIRQLIEIYKKLIKIYKKYYLGVMRRLRETVRQRGKDLWTNNSWILHHDNAPSDSAIIIREFLTKNETNTIQQPIEFIWYGSLRFFSVRSSQKNHYGERVLTAERR